MNENRDSKELRLDPSKLKWIESEFKRKEFNKYKKVKIKYYTYGSLIIREIQPTYNCNPKVYTVLDLTNRYSDSQAFLNEKDAIKYVEKMVKIQDSHGHFSSYIEEA